MERKIVEMCSSSIPYVEGVMSACTSLIVRADDGTLWSKFVGCGEPSGPWYQIEPLPQPSEGERGE